MSLYEICLMLTFGISLAYLLIGETLAEDAQRAGLSRCSSST